MAPREVGSNVVIGCPKDGASDSRTWRGTTVRHVTDRVSSYDASAGSPQYDLPEYTTVDLRTGLQLGSARLQLYVRNAFDERGKLSATTAFSALGGPVWVSLVQPRTIGFNVITQF